MNCYSSGNIQNNFMNKLEINKTNFNNNTSHSLGVINKCFSEAKLIEQKKMKKPNLYLNNKLDNNISSSRVNNRYPLSNIKNDRKYNEIQPLYSFQGGRITNYIIKRNRNKDKGKINETNY